MHVGRPPRTSAMTARVLKFPAKAIRVIRADSGAWLVLAGSHGWLHGDQNSAITDAKWLAENYGLPIRNIGQQRPPRPP